MGYIIRILNNIMQEILKMEKDMVQVYIFRINFKKLNNNNKKLKSIFMGSFTKELVLVMEY